MVATLAGRTGFRLSRFFAVLAVFVCVAATASASLPFDTVFKGKAKFDKLVSQADQWKSLPLGERTAAIGRALVGTPYKGFTLEIHDRIEAPSVNFLGLDCWTFFEVALGEGVQGRGRGEVAADVDGGDLMKLLGAAVASEVDEDGDGVGVGSEEGAG